MNRPYRPAVAAIAIALVAAGCTDGVVDGERVVESSSPDPTAPATAGELEPTDQPLPPGRYTRASFEPRITLALDGGWRAVQLFDGFFDVQHDETIGTPDVIAVQFARPTGVHGPDGLATPSDAAEAAELLAGNPALEAVESSTSRIGGLEGHQVTVENGGNGHAQVLAVPPGPLGIDPGRRLWVAFFDTDDGLLAVMVGGSTAQWQAAIDAAEPILEAIEIGAGD